MGRTGATRGIKGRLSMVRFYSYGLTVVYLACSIVGVLIGSGWGAGGMILGLSVGATLAAGIGMALDKSEGRETAFYAVLSMLFLVAFAWYFTSFGLFST
jgi:hypothetical protein